jgi:hypothetical protein
VITDDTTYAISIYSPATYARSLANDDITYIVMMATLGLMNADIGDLQIGSASTRPQTIGNDTIVEIIGRLATLAGTRVENEYNIAPKPHPNIQPTIVFATSDRRIPGRNRAKDIGKEHARVATDGVRNARVVSVNARSEVKATDRVVSAASISESLTCCIA